MPRPTQGRRDGVRRLVDLIAVKIEIVFVEQLGGTGDLRIARGIGTVMYRRYRGRGAHGATLRVEIKTLRPARRGAQALPLVLISISEPRPPP